LQSILFFQLPFSVVYISQILSSFSFSISLLFFVVVNPVYIDNGSGV
jgi:hypothetical protein